MRAAGAVRYTLGDDFPDHLLPVAVVELADGDSVPADTVRYDLTYYESVEEIPAGVVKLAAHAYTLGQTIPAFLKRICAFVASLLPVEITDGKSLKFNDKTNSIHVLTAGV